MASTDAQVVNIAQGVAAVAEKLKQARVLLQQVLDKNTVESITWDATQDAKLASAGLHYSGVEISNAIGSIALFDSLFWNTHGGNMEQLTKAIV